LRGDGRAAENDGVMRGLVAALVPAVLLVVLAGCGGGSGDSSAAGTRGLTLPDRSVNVMANDPALAAAKVQAQEHWPEFVDSFRKHPPGLEHDVIVNFRRPDGTFEGDWLQVTKIDGENLTGKLVSEPGEISYVYGDTITVNRARVEDWFISEGNKVEQGYFSHDATMGVYGS
jgi:uncharacterized protein YegJ (DUF2314 family)